MSKFTCDDFLRRMRHEENVGVELCPIREEATCTVCLENEHQQSLHNKTLAWTNAVIDILQDGICPLTHC